MNNFGDQCVTKKLRSSLITNTANCKLFVVDVNFSSQIIFVFLLFLGMANEIKINKE